MNGHFPPMIILIVLSDKLVNHIITDNSEWSEVPTQVHIDFPSVALGYIATRAQYASHFSTFGLATCSPVYKAQHCSILPNWIYINSIWLKHCMHPHSTVSVVAPISYHSNNGWQLAYSLDELQTAQLKLHGLTMWAYNCTSCIFPFCSSTNTGVS